MKIPYPKPHRKVFIRAITWLNKQKDEKKYEWFDFPEYAGLPKNIANKLNPEEVDYIQEEIFKCTKFLEKSRQKSSC